MRFKSIVAPALLIGLAAALLIQLPLAIAARADVYEWFDPVIDVRELLLEHFVRAPDEKAMQEAMISGMVATLDDPYTVYIPASDEAEFNKELRGTYVGIGAEVRIQDDYLHIVTPMDDSPALEAGVMAGDTVLEIEGESTFKLSVAECIERLVGEPGTPVKIRVRHIDGTEEELSVLRRQIVTRSVKGFRRVGEGWNYCIDGERSLAYVRVTQFLAESVDDLRAVLVPLAARGELRGLILDLRDNPGGSLQSAVEMSDLFLGEGAPIVSVRGRDENNSRGWSARDAGTLGDFPITVLINGASASASEIVAGALRDNGRAVVIGSRSYGKGSVQEVRELPFNRGTLKLTNAHYYLPSGRNINRAPGASVWGVDPDPGFVLGETTESYIARFRARRDFEVIRAAEADDEVCGTPAWIRDNLADATLAAAVGALQARVDTGAWTPISDLDATEAAVDEELIAASDRRGRLLEELSRVESRMRSLQDMTEAAGSEPLLPEDADVTDGTIEIRDRAGNVIATYRIDGGNLALALRGVRLSPLEPVEAGSE